VFDAGLFQEFEPSEPEACQRRLYVAFERDMCEIEQFRWTALTALFTTDRERMKKETCGGRDWHFLEWLETSRYYDADPDRAQLLRNEFMGALYELHPDLTAEPEEQEAEDGSVDYLDTLDGNEFAKREFTIAG
jgi:hypothetical protein